MYGRGRQKCSNGVKIHFSKMLLETPSQLVFLVVDKAKVKLAKIKIQLQLLIIHSRVAKLSTHNLTRQYHSQKTTKIRSGKFAFPCKVRIRKQKKEQFLVEVV